MLRPIESNLSLYNVESKASQIKDPNAHQYQAMQQSEMDKKSQLQAQTVQPAEKAEGGVRVRERKEDREREKRQEQRKKKNLAPAVRDEDADEQSGGTDAGHGRSGLNFLA